MSTNKDSLQALTESVTKSLGEIVSLRQTCNQHEGTISDLNDKNAEVALELSKAKDEIVKLDEDITGLNKELHGHEELVKKLEKENKALSASLTKLEKTKLKEKKVALKN